MFVTAGQKAAPRVEDQENFRAFKLVVQGGENALTGLRKAPPAGLTFEEDHAWIAADALVSWAGRAEDAAWRENLHRMIAFARQHGWVREEPLSIRAHVEIA